MADDPCSATPHEQTLYVCRDGVKVFSIPATRSSDGRVLSAEWRVDACCFTGRLRLLARGDHAEIRLEDANSGDLFAVAPIPAGVDRSVVVQPVSDSSRNFVLRLADAATGRHAFVGLGFTERPEAFDFNVALGDHDKHVRRAREIEEAKRKRHDGGLEGAAAASASAAVPPSTSSRQAAALPDDSSDSVRSAVSALYGASAGRDLSLKEGETIKVAVVKSGAGSAAGEGGGGGGAAGAAPGGGGGFLARQQTAVAAAAAASGGGGGLFSLPPPPGTGGLAPPPPPPRAAAASGGDPFAANGIAPSAPAPAAAAKEEKGEDQGWATFD